MRYQPNSLDGYWVSKVVVADFAEVAPDRFATLTFPTDTAVSVTVSGVGAAAGSQLGVPPSSMTATVQVQQPAVTDPDLQWVDAAGSEVTLASSEAPGYAFSWSGTATLPLRAGLATDAHPPHRVGELSVCALLWDPHLVVVGRLSRHARHLSPRPRPRRPDRRQRPNPGWLLDDVSPG